MKKILGFSLIEVSITVAIISILTILATALYSPYARKGRRVDGINTMLAISLAEERYRTNNTTYGTLSQAWGGSSTSPEGYYTLSVSNVSATGYTITATAQGSQATDTEGSVSCSTLTLAVAAGTMTKTPTACWPK